MRILFINTERTWRGGERQTLLTALKLRERGHWCGLMVRKGFPLHERAEAEGLPVFPVSPLTPWAPTLAARLTRLSSRERIDIVHAQTPHAVTLVSLARRFGLQAKTVAARRVDFPVNSAGKYNRCHAVVAISEAIREVLVGSGVDEALIHVIPSAVELKRGPELKRHAIVSTYWQEPVTLAGSVGHLAHHKGYDVLLRAWPEVVSALPHARLLLVGDGEERQKLEALIAALDLGNTVALAGFQENTVDYISAFDCYVQPSRTEGLGSTIIDALLLERPMVGTRAGGIPEVLGNGDYGVLVEPENSESLAEALVAVLKGETVVDTAAARRWAEEKFSLTAMTEKTEALYRSLLESSAPENS
jgi:glycosyltransferase involved in cell wall biosynthesis